MKKNVSMVLLSAFTMLIVFSLIGSINVTAVETPDQTIEVQGDTIQTQVQSNFRTMFWFRETTKLTVYANIGLELDINCEALRIGNKDVIIEVEGVDNLRMTMTCTREESQLGLMNGNLLRGRNRNTYRYLEGVCIAMKVNAICDCECKCDPECPNNGDFLKVRLRIRETNPNQLSQWAYYDYGNKEWVTVPTINQDGYLTAETNVLSTWTILTPEETTSAIVSTVAIGLVSAFGILAISVFYLKKKH